VLVTALRAWFGWLLVLALTLGCKKKPAPESGGSSDASRSDAPSAFLPGSAEDVACVSICLRRAEELGCSHGDHCHDLCAKLGAAKICVREVHAFVACFTKQPTSEWKCDAEGMPFIAGHVCEGEQASMSDCLMQTRGKL
jgi:hypothetical protein